jgi:beta-fructofuranosidase
VYSGYGFRESEIGDVDVVVHRGEYHLFHLTLPNHDYIAHAVSRDGLNWRRVRNALFIGDPPAWDDDMLWTMHVSPDPHRAGGWRMFYTGLSMKERGRIQRVGLAVSDDLFSWRKIEEGNYPLEARTPHYEATLDEGRSWVSFRDPYCARYGGRSYLLVSARVAGGPIIRRGCVAVLEETAPHHFELRPPLFHPMRYDDIEVPNVVRLRDRFYLIASIREDIKVHYWHADQVRGPYRNFADSVLLPQGNSAARILEHGDRFLVWNFFYKGLKTDGMHLMVPPKELVADDAGQLRLRRFEGLAKLPTATRSSADLIPLRPVLDNPHASVEATDGSWRMRSDSGMEMFLLQGDYQDFTLTADLHLDGEGKCGLVFRVNEQGDGYFLSLDLYKGIAQLRAWRHSPEGGMEKAFHYQQLQAANFLAREGRHRFSLLAYRQYLELSLDDNVILTLADDQFVRGRLGFYVEGAALRIENLELQTCTEGRCAEYPEALGDL